MRILPAVAFLLGDSRMIAEISGSIHIGWPVLILLLVVIVLLVIRLRK